MQIKNVRENSPRTGALNNNSPVNGALNQPMDKKVYYQSHFLFLQSTEAE